MRTSSASRVRFASSTRRLQDDEISMMNYFLRHASRCQRCRDPYKVLLSGANLCELGRAYARDVMKFIFPKDGKPFSVIDYEFYGEVVQLRLPEQLNFIENLLKAIEGGLWIGKGQSRPKHTVYHVLDCKQPAKGDSKNGKTYNQRAAAYQTRCFVKENKGEKDTRKKDTEKRITVYARLMPTVVKLELRPIGNQQVFC